MAGVTLPMRLRNLHQQAPEKGPPHSHPVCLCLAQAKSRAHRSPTSIKDVSISTLLPQERTLLRGVQMPVTAHGCANVTDGLMLRDV